MTLGHLWYCSWQPPTPKSSMHTVMASIIHNTAPVTLNLLSCREAFPAQCTRYPMRRLVHTHASSSPSRSIPIKPIISVPRPPPPRPIYFFLQVNLFRVLHRHQPPEPPRPLPGKYSRRKLPQLVPHHLVRNHHVVVHLTVVHLEYQSHHVGQDGRRARLRADWRDFLAGEDFEDWETGACVRSEGAGGPGGLGEGGVTGRCAGLDWGGVSLGG